MKLHHHLPYAGPLLEYRQTGRFPWVRTAVQSSIIIPFKFWYINHFLGASLTGGGQLAHARGIIADSLWAGETSLIQSLKGSRPPPGPMAALAVGGYLLHDIFPMITEVVNPSNPFSAV